MVVMMKEVSARQVNNSIYSLPSSWFIIQIDRTFPFFTITSRQNTPLKLILYIH
jgi:hypothetical protein